MELRHLRYFVAVAEERNFTRAAERLWIAQPGLSQQIRSLERELGVCLFERLSRGVELTDVGRVFLDKARLAIAAADEALTMGHDAAAGIIGNLRLGLSTQARAHLWPLVIGTFSEQRPGVEVTVVEAESDTLLDDLRDGRLDAAILIGSSTSANVRSVLLQERRVNVAMSCHHRLAGHDRITATDLTDEVVAVSGQRGGATYDGIVCRLLDSLGLRHQLRPSGYGSALLAPVQAGSAIAFVPAHEVDGDPRITVRPLEPASMFRFELVWQAGVTSAVVDTFVETCTKTVAGRAERIPAARPAEFAGRRIAA